MDLNRIATFVHVVETGSFTAAAHELGLPTSSVSRTISGLEAELGVRLLQRSTRRVQPTDAGNEFYTRVRAAVSALDEASKIVAEQGETPKGTVRLTAPPSGGAPVLAELIVEFVRKYPEIRVELILTPRFVDLLAEGVDLALRAGRLNDSSLMARKLASIDGWVVASPRYLKGRKLPLQPRDLGGHECVLHKGKNGRTTWRLTGPEGEELVEVNGAIDADDLAFVHATVLAGAGVGLLPTLLAAPDVESGLLVRLLPKHTERGVTMHLLWPSSSHLPIRVALLRDFLAERMVARCPQHAASS